MSPPIIKKSAVCIFSNDLPLTPASSNIDQETPCSITTQQRAKFTIGSPEGTPNSLTPGRVSPSLEGTTEALASLTTKVAPGRRPYSRENSPMPNSIGRGSAPGDWAVLEWLHSINFPSYSKGHILGNNGALPPNWIFNEPIPSVTEYKDILERIPHLAHMFESMVSLIECKKPIIRRTEPHCSLVFLHPKQPSLGNTLPIYIGSDDYSFTLSEKPIIVAYPLLGASNLIKESVKENLKAACLELNWEFYWIDNCGNPVPIYHYLKADTKTTAMQERVVESYGDKLTNLYPHRAIL